MCYRTKLNSRLIDIEKSFDASFIEPELYSPMQEINAFEFKKTPVIIDENPGKVDFFQWGLVPFWCRDDKIKKMTLNAKIETLKEKPAFRDSVQDRCLVIANGYYEWQWLDAKGKEKQKYLITPKDQGIFAFAGIYSSWKNPDTNQLINSYTIITTQANELMGRIHNNRKRMPVLLRKEDRNNWFSGKETGSFAFPYEVALDAKAL